MFPCRISRESKGKEGYTYTKDFRVDDSILQRRAILELCECLTSRDQSQYSNLISLHSGLQEKRIRLILGFEFRSLMTMYCSEDGEMLRLRRLRRRSAEGVAAAAELLAERVRIEQTKLETNCFATESQLLKQFDWFMVEATGGEGPS